MVGRNLGISMIFNNEENEIRIKKIDNSIELDDQSNDIAVIFCNLITTSIFPNDGDLIRLNMKLCYVNDKGNFTKIRKTISFFQDPSRELKDDEKKFLDFPLDKIKGKKIDWDLVESLLNQADVIVSHNASFVRPWINKNLDDSKNVWACTLENVDWNSLNFPGRNLETLSVFSGFFYDFSSSKDSLDAVIKCLSLNNQVSSLIKKAFSPDFQVYAANAPIEYKDNLKQRGYRWNPDLKCWWKPTEDKESSEVEKSWLIENIPSVEPQVFEVEPKFRFI